MKKYGFGIVVNMVFAGIILGTLGTWSVPLGHGISAFWPAFVVQATGGAWFGGWGVLAAVLFPIFTDWLANVGLSGILGFIPANLAQGLIPALAFRYSRVDPAIPGRKGLIFYAIWGALIPAAAGGLIGSVAVILFGEASWSEYRRGGAFRRTGCGHPGSSGSGPAMLGSLGLAMFVYGIGIHGKEFFLGLSSPFGLKLNGLALLSHLVAFGVCYVAFAAFAVAPAAVAGLFAGALTSTPALQAAIGAAGNNDPALGYSVAYPFGLIAPILCIYFFNQLLKPKIAAGTGTGLELHEIVVRNAQVIGRPLAEVSAALPAGVQIVLVREGQKNRVPAA